MGGKERRCGSSQGSGIEHRAELKGDQHIRGFGSGEEDSRRIMGWALEGRKWAGPRGVENGLGLEGRFRVL